MSKYNGRDLRAHNAWIKENADYFTVFLWRTKQRYEAKTLEEAKDAAVMGMMNSERHTQPAMIYAVKDVHSALVGSYHPVTGFKVIDN